MKKVSAERVELKKLFPIILVLLLVITGCERPATRSNWSPIEDVGGTETVSALPETLPSTTDAAEITATASQAMGTLDPALLPTPLPHSIKGYELYSWQTGEDWNFTLITGTNRIKTFEEIIASGNTVNEDGFIKVSVGGVDELKKLLKLLPTGESILWGGMDLGSEVPIGTIYLTLPPQSMINEVTRFCASLGLDLTSIQTQ